MSQPVAISAPDRDRTLDALERESFDLAVIGGGITGAGIAREAGRRGLRVALLEASDFASGTSSRSSKLIHGGLRYLAMGDVALVRETALERKEVRRLAPHLAEPRRMVLPVTSRAGLLKFRLAIGTYEKLGAVEARDRHENWDAEDLAREEPALDRSRHPWACAYREYLTDDARLVLANLRDAVRLGARVLNHAPVVDLVLEQERVAGLVAACAVTGRRVRVRARAVINAAGPWVEAVRRLETGDLPPWLHLSTGIHVGVPTERFPVRHMVMLRAHDGRTIFAIARDDVTYLGTTDTTHPGGPEEWPGIQRDDVEYLLEPVPRYFGVSLGVRDVVTAWSGIRPLVAEPGKAPTEISRKDEIVLGTRGLISIAGGKLTGYRPMALAALERASEVLGSPLPPAGEDPPLPGGDFDGDLEALARRLVRDVGIESACALRAARLYGSEAHDVLKADPEPLASASSACAGEVDWAVEREGASTLEDVIYRRLRAPLFETGVGDLLEPVAARLAARLDWDAARVQQEIASVRARLAADLDFSDETG